MLKHKQPLFLLQLYIKPLILLISGLYLLGFSFNGLNVYGFIDELIPIERLFCGLTGLICLLWFIIASDDALKFIKKLWGEKKKNETKQ